MTGHTLTLVGPNLAPPARPTPLHGPVDADLEAVLALARSPLPELDDDEPVADP